jgi:hypothetical protein
LTGDGDEVTATDDSTGEADGRMAADGDDERMTHVSDDRWCEVLTVVLTVVRVIAKPCLPYI